MKRFDAKRGIIHYSERLTADVAEDIIDRFGYPALLQQLCEMLRRDDDRDSWAAITFICDGFSGSWSERTQVQFERYIIGDGLIAALEQCLCGNNYFSRTHAAHAFGKLGNAEHIPILQRAFGLFYATDPFLCRRLLVELYLMGDVDRHLNRIELLCSSNYLARWCAIDSIIDTIEHMGDTLLQDTQRMPLIEKLQKFTYDRSMYVRRIAEYSLALLDLKQCQHTLSQKAFVKHKTKLMASNVILFQDLDARFSAQLDTPEYDLQDVTDFLQTYYI